MLTLPASQSELAGRGSVAPIVLVHLTTYTNYTSETVESEWWWTKSHPVLYPWAGGSAQTFEDAIRFLSPITRRMEHLPNAEAIDTRRTVLSLTLANDVDGNGDSLWKRLRTKNLHFARIEVASLLVDPVRLLDVSDGAKRWDLRDLPGTEHVFRFRGELTGIETVTETEIPLTFETREPNLDWPVCFEASECDPRHLGKRYPIPVGRAKSVPVTNRRVGWVTTLAQLATSSTTGNVTVTDATGFPSSGSFTVQVGAERVTASYVNPTTVNISARGQAGTAAIAHNQGERMVEILSSSVLVFSGIEAKALDALYVISPLDGERVRIDPALYSVNLADTSIDSGRTLGTVTFTAANFQTMIDRMLAVSQQPTINSQTERVYLSTYLTQDPAWDPNGGSGAAGPTNVDAQLFTDGHEGALMAANSGNSGLLGCYFNDAHPMPGGTRTVIQYRIVAKFNVRGGGSNPATQVVCGWKDQTVGGTRTFSEVIYTGSAGSEERGIVAATGWTVPPGGYTLESFRDSPFINVNAPTSCSLQFDFWINQGAGGGPWSSVNNYAALFTNESYIEFEVEGNLTDVGIAALALGWGLDFVADVQGAQTSGTLHESGPDVLEWFLEDFAGLGAGAADASSFATAETNLGSNVYAGVLNLAGESFGEVVARLCFEMRSNLFAREASTGTVYHLVAAESDYGFPASLRTLSEIQSQTETGRAAVERATRFRAFYALDLDQKTRVLNEDDFPNVVRIDADQNDASAKLATSLLTAAEALLGRRDALPASFLLIQDAATAIDVLAYYAYEALRTGSRHAGSVPWDAGYDVELGDPLELTPRDAASPVKGRVTQTVILLDEARVGLNLEEVE